MKRTSLYLILIFLMVTAYGQKLTFKEAVELGLKENINLKIQKNQLDVIHSQKLQNSARFFPTISLNGSASRTDGQQIDPVTGQGSNVTSDFANVSIGASIGIFNGFNRISSIKQSNSQFSAQQDFVKRSEQTIIFDVATQYLQILLDQELVRIAQETLSAQQAVLDQITAFVELGMRPITDQYNQEALVKNNELLIIRAENNLRNDKSFLAQTLQLDPSVNFELEYPNWKAENIAINSYNLSELYEGAIQQRPDLKQFQALETSSRYSIKTSTSGYYPNLSFGVRYGTQYFSRGAANESSFSSQFFDLNPTTSYGFNLFIPIFDGFQTRTNRVAAKINHDNARINKLNLEKTIKIDVQRAYQNYQDAISAYTASLAQLQSAELAIETQRESYQLGISSQAELSQSNQAYVTASSQKAQSEFTLLFQKILLDYAVGTLKFEDIP